MSLASLHPQVVHFVIALLVAGVVFRWMYLTDRFPFAGPAAALLLLVGAAAAVLAVESGDAAHGPVERIPGVRAAVMAHQDWGERTRNVFLGVGLFEVLALGLARTRYRRPLLVASGLLGLGGVYALYETGSAGGALVYSYAGGVGTRSGNADDVSHLLVAGLYQQAMVDRAQGKAADASALINELTARYPADTLIRLLAIESLVLDRQDGRGALAALARIGPPQSRFLRFRMGMLRADAYAAAGMADSAKAVLQAMSGEFPGSRAIQERLATLQ